MKVSTKILSDGKHPTISLILPTKEAILSAMALNDLDSDVVARCREAIRENIVDR